MIVPIMYPSLGMAHELFTMSQGSMYRHSKSPALVGVNVTVGRPESSVLLHGAVWMLSPRSNAVRLCSKSSKLYMPPLT